jgi:hypothetical protein
MSLTNEERATRYEKAIAGYSDDDSYTNLIDYLADAMHFCHLNGHSFTEALETAVMHFDAEWAGDDILDDLNRQPTAPVGEPSPMQDHDRGSHFCQIADEALAEFWHVIVRRFPEAETGDLSPLTAFRLQEAAQAAIEEWVWANVPTTASK